MLGDDFIVASRWLSPTNTFASSIPDARSSNVWLRAIEDQPHQFLLFDDDAKRIVEVDRADVAVFSVDWRRVAASLCASGGFEPLANAFSTEPAWQIGTDRPRMGFSFPVFLQRGPLISALTIVADQTEAPHILLRLRPKNIDAISSRMLREGRGLLLTLTESTQINDQGEIVFTAGALERIDSFRKSHLPVEQKNSVAPNCGFPTPAGCKWSAVKIRFMDGNTVTISAGEVAGRYLYSQMGFANSSNKRANVQWELLRSLAQGHGTMTWHSPGASRKNQKRCERLSKTLIRFFGIQDDPIELLPERMGWQTRFSLEPER